jgi:hypothetical protein
LYAERSWQYNHKCDTQPNASRLFTGAEAVHACLLLNVLSGGRCCTGRIQRLAGLLSEHTYTCHSVNLQFPCNHRLPSSSTLATCTQAVDCCMVIFTGQVTCHSRSESCRQLASPKVTLIDLKGLEDVKSRKAIVDGVCLMPRLAFAHSAPVRLQSSGAP